MKDDEVFTTNEFNNSKELNSFSNENYAPLENIKTFEKIDIKEDNDCLKKVETTNKVTKGFKFKDRVIESTGPFRTIVSAATCTVAVATAATTVFLMPSPNVDNVKLECGNDYVQYSLNIDSLDKDSSYMIEVSNPKFDYKEEINLEEVDSLEFLNGFVNGLKPNNKYDFKLLRNNGDIGGYSEYYSKKFYTLKPADPTVIFDFNLENDVLEYKAYISDYYNVCENSYITYQISEDESAREYIDNKEYSSAIDINGDKSITFNVYTTLYDEDILLSSYQYDLMSFEANFTDNELSIIGNVGDKYKLLKNVDIALELYNNESTLIDTLYKESNDVIDINEVFTLDDSIASYSYTISFKDMILYQSDREVNPLYANVAFTTQSIVDEGLKVLASNISPNSTVGYITDDNNNNINLIIGDDYIIIPLFDDNGNRYHYSNYQLNINDNIYNLTPDMSLLNVNGFQLFTISGKVYLHSEGYVSLYEQSKLKVDLYMQDQLVNSSIIEDDKVNIPLDILTGDNQQYDIKYCLLDSNEQSLGVESTINGITNERIDISLSFASNYISVEALSLNTDDINITFTKYNANYGIINKEQCNLISSDNGMVGTINIDDTVFAVSYNIYINNEVIYEGNIQDIIKFTNQEITNEGLKIDTTNVSGNATGYIRDNNDQLVDIIFNDANMIIPLIDSNGNNYIFSEYKVYITDDVSTSAYILDVNDLLFEIEGVFIYQINDFTYIKINGYKATSYNSRLKVNISTADYGDESFYFDFDKKYYILQNNYIQYDGLVLTYYKVDEFDNKLSDEKTIDNATLENIISVTESCQNRDFTVNINSGTNYSLVLNTYDEDGNLITSTNEEFEYTEANGIFTKVLDNNVKYVSYQILLDDMILYEFEEFELLDINITGQKGNNQGICLSATGINQALTGTISDINDNKYNLTFTDEAIIIPYLNDQYERITYSDYTLTISNGINEVIISDPITDAFTIENIRLQNDYSGNGLIFDSYPIQHDTSYSLEIEAYSGATLIQSDSIDYSQAFGYVFSLPQINNSDNLDSDLTFKIYLKDEQGNKLTNIQEYNILGKDRSIANFNMNSTNPGEIPITENADGTINMYIKTNYSCDDPDAFVRITLNDDIIIDTTDIIVALENYENKPYSINYKVIKQSTDMIMVFADTTPSGVINESGNIEPSIIKETDNLGNIYASISLADIVPDDYDFTKSFFEGHDDATYDEASMTWKVLITNIETNLIFHLNFKDSNFDYYYQDLLTTDPDFTYKGDPNRTWVYELEIPE